jgi:hypothetical protein
MGEMYRSCGRTAPTCERCYDVNTLGTTPPFAEDAGAFPVRLQIDFNNDNTIDDVLYVNSQGPIGGNTSISTSFGSYTFPEGTHRLVTYVDIPGTDDPGRGCDRAVGCVDESSNGNNETEILITVARPSITLGSFLIPGSSGSEQSRPVEDFSADYSRDITDYTGDVGLYWEGEHMDVNSYRSCTGTGPGFSAQYASGDQNYRARFEGYANRNDAVIDEPAPGDTHAFTISCTSNTGEVVTDEFYLTNDGVVPEEPEEPVVPVVPDAPVIPDLTDAPPAPECNDSTNNDPAEDNLTDAADPGCHTDGDPNDPGDPNNTGSTNNCPSATCSYDPNDNDETDEPLCSNNGDDDDDGYTDAADPGCHTDGDPDNPASYDPTRDSENDPATIRVTDTDGNPVTVVRQGDDVVVEWDTNGNTGCTLSSNLGVSGNDADLQTTATVEARRTTDYTIDCPTFDPISVRLQVIPILFET